MGDRGVTQARLWDQRFARWSMRALVGTGVTPNMVTLAGLAAGAGAGILFAVGWNLPAGALFVLALLADHADGELARLSGRTSRLGHVLDRVVSAANYVLVMAGIGVGLDAATAGLVAGGAIAGIFAVRNAGDWRHGSGFDAQPSLAGFEPEDLMYGIALLAWFGGLPEFLGLAAVGAPIYLAFVATKLLMPRADRRDSRPE